LRAGGGSKKVYNLNMNLGQKKKGGEGKKIFRVVYRVTSPLLRRENWAPIGRITRKDHTT